MSRIFCAALWFLLLGLVALPSGVSAAERPTMNVTCDPRPDILAHPLYDAHQEYRRVYNRPRYLTGWLAHHVAPSSQEAMVWCENYQAGAYEVKHAPPRYKRYFGPKPWEVLQTGSRPDIAKPKSNAASSTYNAPQPTGEMAPVNLAVEPDPNGSSRNSSATMDSPDPISTEGRQVPAPLVPNSR